MALKSLLALPLAVLSTVAVAGNVCHPLVLSENPTGEGSSELLTWVYSLASGQLSGGSDPDSAELQLFSADDGTFDLGSGDNANYATCEQCTLYAEDLTGIAATKYYFPDQGLLQILDIPGTNPLPIAFSGVRLVEVTIDPDTYVSTPVPGGDCWLAVTDAIFASGFESP